MTSSESTGSGVPPGESPAAQMTGSTSSLPAPDPAQTQILAQGHLHPGILFLRLASALRSTIIPTLIAVFVFEGAASYAMMGVAVFLLVMSMAYSLIRFVTFRYWLTTEELITTEGIFNRQERRIPVNRVQDLSFEQTLVRRFFGLVVVTVETASGEGAEARLDSLGLRPAAKLREAMQFIRAQSPTAPATAGVTATGVMAPAGVADQQVLFRVRALDLILRGLTDNRAGVIIIGLFVIAEQADQFGAFGFLKDLFDQVIQSLENLEVTMMVLVLVLLLLLVVVLGWVVSIAASFLLFHGFTLVRRGEVFQRRYGLLTTRVRSLPKQKIQRVLMEQNLLRRIFRLVVVRADSAGSGTNQKEEVKGGLDVVAPMTGLPTGRMLVPHLLPGMFAEHLQWSRVSGKVVTRLFAEGVVLALLVLGIGLPTVGQLSLLAILLPIFMLFTGVLVYHNLGYAHTQGHFAMRWGMLGRYRAFIPLRKVQAVALRAGPWDRLFGLARLVVYVAGARPTTLQHLTRADASRLQRALATVAAHSRFVW
ncbi:MAG: PH domain-containing protein [Planctomycetota bacterium]|nr:PH domain-containing protein [Planctomycetota bacterium]